MIDNPSSEKIYLVLEYLKGGEVKWKSDTEKPLLSESIVRYCMRDVIAGVQYRKIVKYSKYHIKCIIKGLFTGILNQQTYFGQIKDV